MESKAGISICMLSDDFLPAATGVGTHLQEVSKLLAKSGNRIAIITSRRPGQPEFESWEGVLVYRTFTIKAFGFYQAIPSVAAIEKIFAEVQPDVVHYHYLGMMLLRAMKVAQKLSLPQVYTYHMTEDHLTQPLPMRPFRKLIAGQIVRICNRVDLIISVSQGIARLLPQKGISTPIRYISNPVSFAENIAVEPLSRNSPFVVLFAGRLNPEKNIPYLIRGFRGLLYAVPKAVLWIAGHGSQKERLQGLCKELGIEDQVHFLGFLAHDILSNYYASCDVFVLPSLVETQGLVAMEAMWFRKPIIVARSVVSASELVNEGRNGFIVDHDSDAALTARLLDLASNPDLREKMGSSGREMALSYRPPAILAALQAAYFDTLKRRGASFDRNPVRS